MSLQEHTIHFVPLPSRRLIDDTYWKRFTLLGQSLGSIWLLLQGIGVIGRDGVWGDYFIGQITIQFLSIRLMDS
jgi:alpha-1,2-mannosyltransferase